MVTASWYHCSLKQVSRSAGRSVVAAAAYRLGECLHDDMYATKHDYTRKRGVDLSFTVAPADAPEWAYIPEKLWNAVEHAETRKNSRLAREIELALPSLLSLDERRAIVERFAKELVSRYQVAVSAALHSPSSQGDPRNVHAHILFTTREMTPGGLVAKTRILDDRKTGPQEVVKLRKLAADIINDALRAANADIRVDHRSFQERGINQEPTVHLGPAATEMERRGEPSGRGDINREAVEGNALIADRERVEQAIDAERERIASPPLSIEDAQERAQQAAAPLVKTIAIKGHAPDREADGLQGWQRAGMRLASRARTAAVAMALKAREYLLDNILKGIDR